MKKILFVIDSLGGGGAERVLVQLANVMDHMGHKVDIVLTYGKSVYYEVAENVGLYSIDGKVLDKALSSMTSAKGSSSAVKVNKKTGIYKTVRNQISEIRDQERHAHKLAEFVNKNGYDAVISFLNSSNVVVCRAKKYTDAKIIISERGDPYIKVFSSKSRKTILRQYAHADVVVFQTEDAKNAYPAKISNKGVIIVNPIKERLPDRYIGQRRKEIVSYARLDSQKNFPLLIGAFSEVVKKHPEYTLKIYGNGPLKDELEDLIQSLKLDNCAFIEPFNENIHEIIRDAALYVSSSDHEGISNSMIESLGVGLPSVCTDCPIGGAKMMITSGENGILVPVGDKDELVKAMLQVIENPDLAEKLSENSVKIRETLDVNRIVNSWLELI